jgi:hypothetical protein
MSLDLNLIALAVVSFVSIVLAGISVRLRLRLNKSVQVSTQLFIDRVALQEEIDRLSFINSNSTDLENGFVKFLSESRDQAFSYIEEVQNSIVAIKVAMDLNDEALIEEAYIKLISFLPSDSTDVVE